MVRLPPFSQGQANAVKWSLHPCASWAPTPRQPRPLPPPFLILSLRVDNSQTVSTVSRLRLLPQALSPVHEMRGSGAATDTIVVEAFGWDH